MYVRLTVLSSSRTKTATSILAAVSLMPLARFEMWKLIRKAEYDAKSTVVFVFVLSGLSVLPLEKLKVS